MISSLNMSYVLLVKNHHLQIPCKLHSFNPTPHSNTMSESKETIVLFPYSSGMGHLIPILELAKLFVADDFSVAIPLVHSPFSSPVNSSFISTFSSAHPSISFHFLPKLSIPASELSPYRPLANLQLVRRSNPLLSSFLVSLNKNSQIRALVFDMFCTSALDVARQLDIPAFVFFASSASTLSALISIPIMQSSVPVSFKDLGDAPVKFPGLPPIPASHVPAHLQDPESEIYKARVYDMERIPRADGILVNTFESLEEGAVRALKEEVSCPMPPVYCIGPLIGGGEGESHACLTWLDDQPKGSVVFLCFGSMGSFSAEQVKEIAVGLESSGQRFLWVVRDPTGSDPDLAELLPRGFFMRTRDRGMVVKSWAPQAAVLKHGSVGGFVSHCGWNSTLEAICNGVAMIAWPLYAEQRMNMTFLVEEAKIAVEMKGFDKEIVKAEEVEAKVRWMMESEGGREMRGRAVEMKEAADAARREGGSSANKWAEFVRGLRDE